LSAARPPAPLALENACATLLTLAAAADFTGETREPAGWRAAGQTRYFEQAAALLLGRIGQQAAKASPIGGLAAELYLSPRQLQRIFLAQAGMSPLAYAQLLRLSEANLLLACTTDSISGIAARLGYANAAHFSAAFRRAYRCAPRQVRERPDPADAPAKEDPWL
ncbi:MAG TPA: helix-turn-helix domain-containing protein, partial [Herpetosiphonaceae bacterium]